MKLRTTLMAALALFAFTLMPAAAADLSGRLSEVADSSPARKIWTGFYVGAHGGMDLTSTEASIGGLGIDGLAGNGAGYGVHAGADLHVRGTPFVLGIIVDYGDSSARFAVSPGLLSADLDESWSVVGRIGYAHGHSLIYALGGYTEADVSAKLLGTSIGGTTLEGWVFGGGVTIALMHGFEVDLSYRRTEFDKINFGGVGGLDLKTERHEARLGVNYRFNPF